MKNNIRNLSYLFCNNYKKLLTRRSNSRFLVLYLVLFKLTNKMEVNISFIIDSLILRSYKIQNSNIIVKI